MSEILTSIADLSPSIMTLRIADLAVSPAFVCVCRVCPSSVSSSGGHARAPQGGSSSPLRHAAWNLLLAMQSPPSPQAGWQRSRWTPTMIGCRRLHLPVLSMHPAPACSAGPPGSCGEPAGAVLPPLQQRQVLRVAASCIASACRQRSTLSSVAHEATNTRTAHPASCTASPCRWSGTLSNFMREATQHLCKRLVAEHYAAINARSGSDSGQAAFIMCILKYTLDLITGWVHCLLSEGNLTITALTQSSLLLCPCRH